MIKISAAAAGALLIACAGCYSTDLARPPVSQEEKAWEDIIRESYPGYKAPPKTIRMVNDHTENRVSAVITKPQAEAADEAAEKKNAAAPQELPVNEPAAEEKAEKPAAEVATAEKPASAAVETAPADKPAEKVEEKAAEAEPAGKTAEEKVEEKAEKPAEAKSSTVMPPDPTNSSVYVVKSGDTLGGISQKNYGNAGYSNNIYKANSDILKDPNKLRPGMKLIIPKL